MNAFSKTAVETHVLRSAESRRSRSTESMFYGWICSSVFSGSSLFFELFSKRRDFETYQYCLYIDSLAQSDTATNALASPPSFAAPIAGRWLLASLHVSYKTFCHSISSRLATDHVPYFCWSIFPRSSTDEASNSSAMPRARLMRTASVWYPVPYLASGRQVFLFPRSGHIL